VWTDKNRAKYNRDHLRYPSDLTDDEWAYVEPLIPPAKRGGAPAISNLLAGQVQAMFEFIGPSIEHVRNGGLRPLGVTSAMRSKAAPNVPTVGELLPGYEASSWLGIAAPKQTPIDIVDRLNREINAALDDARMRARIAELGSEPSYGSPADFAKIIAADTEKWGKVIRAAKIKAS